MRKEDGAVEKRTEIFYSDELNDEFSTAVITPRRIDAGYVYDRKGPIRAFTRFFWYRIVATPLAFGYVKWKLHQRTVGKEKLKPFRKQAFFLYGNHTQQVGDPLTPNILCFPKPVSFIVHPNNVSMPYLGRITPTLGAIPIPDDMAAFRNFTACISGRVKKKHAIVIYPEAHIWPYYTRIRPFPDASFGYPARLDTPVFCFVNTYQTRKKCKTPRMVSYIEGPFFPDASLPYRERVKKLRDQVYEAMCSLAGRSDCEFIHYIRKEPAVPETEPGKT